MAGGRGQRPGDRRRLGMAGTTAGRRLGPRGAEAAAPEGRRARRRPASRWSASRRPPGCNDPAAQLSLPRSEAAADAGPVPGPGPSPAAPRPSCSCPSAAAAVPPGGEAALPGAGGRRPGAGSGGAVARAGCGRVCGGDAAARVRGAAGALNGWPARRAGSPPRRGCWRPSAPASGWIRHDRAVQAPAAAEAGPLAGLVALPDLRTLRPALASIADRTDPLRLQQMFAAAMLAADPVTSGVYYIDDHFVPYAAPTGGKSWNNKRGRQRKPRDTHVPRTTGGRGSGPRPRAVRDLAEGAGRLRRHPSRTTIIGFDRARLPASLQHCRSSRCTGDLPAGPLPSRLSRLTTVTPAARPGAPGPGESAAQTTAKPAAHPVRAQQVVSRSSPPTRTPAHLLLKSRARNYLKRQRTTASQICDYAAEITVNTKSPPTPHARTQRPVRDAKRSWPPPSVPSRRCRRPGHHGGRRTGDPRRQPRDQHGEENVKAPSPPDKSRDCPPTR